MDPWPRKDTVSQTRGGETKAGSGADEHDHAYYAKGLKKKTQKTSRRTK